MNEYTKFLFISDDHIHTDKETINQCLNKLGFNPFLIENTIEVIKFIKPKAVFHCGDIVSDGAFEKLINYCKENNTILSYTKGNWDDWMLNTEENKIVYASHKNQAGQDIKIFQFHSNGYWKPTDNNFSDFEFMWGKFINKYIKEKNVNPDIVLVGHTHRQIFETNNNRILINPGSVNWNYHWKKLPEIGGFAVLYIDEKNINNSFIKTYNICINEEGTREFKESKTYLKIFNK